MPSIPELKSSRSSLSKSERRYYMDLIAFSLCEEEVNGYVIDNRYAQEMLESYRKAESLISGDLKTHGC